MIIGASSGSPIIFIIILAFAVIYLLFVRPQRRRQSQQQQMVNELRVGDEVLTAGGIYGTISELDDDQVVVQIAPQTEVRVARRAIAGVTREPEEEEAAEPEVQQEDEDSTTPGSDPSTEDERG